MLASISCRALIGSLLVLGVVASPRGLGGDSRTNQQFSGAQSSGTLTGRLDRQTVSVPQKPVILTSSPGETLSLDVVRVIYTRKFGVKRPAGFAYSERAEAFVVLEVESGALSAEPQLRMVLMDLSEEPVCSKSFPLSVSGPLDVTVTGAGESLLIQDALGKRWLRTSADCREQGGELSNAFEMGALETQGGGATAYDPQSGDLFTLEAGGRQIHRTYAIGAGEPDVTVAKRMSRSAWVRLQQLGEIAAGTLAIHPQSGHFFVLNMTQNKLVELSRTGALVATRDLSLAELVNPVGMAFAPSGDSTDDPANINLYIADSGQSATKGARPGSGKIVELTLKESRLGADAAATIESLAAVAETGNLVNTIRTSQFSPPSPDPAGVEYVPATDTLWIADSEVDEMNIFKGSNVFESTRAGNLVRTHNTMAFSVEPTGIAYDTVSGHFFISSDSGDRFYEVTLGADGKMGTSDDVVITVSAAAFGCSDPEGIAFDSANRVVYLGCGVDAEVVVVRPGPNNVFDGPKPSGDDVSTHFDTAVLGVADLEGIAYNPDSGTLFLASRKDTAKVFEVSTSGTLLRTIDISAANAVAPAGVGYGTGSAGTASKSLYLSDRGIDNGSNPNENDGKVYEFALQAGSSTAPSISSFTPTSGLVGTAVTIFGVRFSGAAAVAFNGMSAAFTLVSDTQIDTTVPAGATTGRISVTTPEGTGNSAADFGVIVAPTISAFTPANGPVGATVTVTGAGFIGTTQVAFGGVNATSFTVNSNTQITATVPVGAQTGKISVTNAAGSASSASDFVIVVAPTIASFTPTSGKKGTVVTITGTGFIGVNKVTFNGRTANNFTVDSNTQVRAVVPPSARTGPVGVTNAAGSALSTINFTVLN